MVLDSYNPEWYDTGERCPAGTSDYAIQNGNYPSRGAGHVFENQWNEQVCRLHMPAYHSVYHDNWFWSLLSNTPGMVYLLIGFAVVMFIAIKSPRTFWGIAAVIGAMMLWKHHENNEHSDQ